jgi:peptidoglycan/LPS O-acetylase OafA/YrhL
VHAAALHGFTRPVNGRAVQLDGLRAVAMIAICWDHWCPPGWPRVFPFEIFLFFFLVLTGYLITGSLLRERDRKEARGGPWKLEGLRVYQVRRGLRILAPYYAAIILAWLVWAPDMHAAFGWYFFHVSNIHMASLNGWPSGTNHFWSLAMQQQFYLIWPFVIWFLPRKSLAPAILVFAAIGPASRFAEGFFLQWFERPGILTWANFDYFGIGGLLALAVHHGMSLESPLLRWLSVLGISGYVAMFGSEALGGPTFGLRPLQQTFLSVGLCGFIAAGIVGFRGPLGSFLVTPRLLYIGQISYGIYLFHNLAPLLVGKLLPVLWAGPLDSSLGGLVRIPVYAAVTWGLTLASWRWIETPMQAMRSKIAAR